MRNQNLKIIFILGGILLTSLFWYFALDPVYKAIFKVEAPKEATQVDSFSLKSLEGELVDLSQIKNQIIIVNFWASWCPPCLEEFPSLAGLVRKFNGKILLLAISVDENAKDLENFLKRVHSPSPHIKIFRDPWSDLRKRFGTSRLPESYILNPKHGMVRKVAGSINWMSAENIQYFQQLIDTSIIPKKTSK